MEDQSIITNETMENFIKENEQLLTAIRTWMWSKAEILDWKSINHFQAITLKLQNEAVLLARRELDSMGKTH